VAGGGKGGDGWAGCVFREAVSEDVGAIMSEEQKSQLVEVLYLSRIDWWLVEGEWCYW
jgi:hypothetical protein